MSTHARILGVGAYRPIRSVPNSEIVDRIDSSDDWIKTRSGITSRRIAGPDETVISMSVEAANDALEHAGIGADQIDAVVVATVSHLMQTPAAAAMISHQLGATPAAAFDVSAACAGFCYGIALASDMVKGESAGHVLVIGVEKLSDITNPVDRGTAFIFADGAGAAVVGPSEEPGISPVVWGADGEQYDLIRQTVAWDDVFATPDKEWPALQMQGSAVFRWASFAMAKVAQQALAAAELSVDDLDAFIPHQANMRITDAMARTLKLPERVVIARDIAEQGNTSAASVPLAMHRLIDEGQVKPGDKALLIAFGAGLAYAAQVVTIP
ncbi:MAG: ketoacyl-ACP synthase III [Nocardioidaceae bacterium]|jgi:3-oxoacyl-(acyl-carrier-protein) synthase III|nr:ketoacyl-ACP synthase III [Nocardioidaceae bacterium]